MIMRTLLSLVFAVFATNPLFAGPCTGAEAQLVSVLKQLAHGAPHVAEGMLAAFEATHANCPEILLARARILAEKGQAAEAAGMFMHYLDLAPDDLRGYTFFGRFLLEQRQYERADALSVSAMEKGPNDADALALRGQILDMKGEGQAGLKLLERACQLDPGNADAQFYLGSVYDRAKRPRDAVKHLEKAVGTDPHNPRAWDYLALNLEPGGEVERAEQAYKTATGVNVQGPHFDAFLDYNYGRFLMKRNELAASKSHLDRAVELVPQVRAVWYERAKLNLRLKNYQQARTDAEKAAGLEDRAGVVIDLQIYWLLEQIYRHLGETELSNKYAELSRETPVPARGDRR
jgi:tetratricopeptide (TPR) repeat protein